MRPGFTSARSGLANAAATLVLAIAPRAWSQGTPQALAPAYNPDSKSYFELRTDLPKPPQWRTAEAFARTKVFKGTRGHLAIVKDLETHSFLQANFPLFEEAWIGLRFYCSIR